MLLVVQHHGLLLRLRLAHVAVEHNRRRRRLLPGDGRTLPHWSRAILCGIRVQLLLLLYVRWHEERSRGLLRLLLGLTLAVRMLKHHGAGHGVLWLWLVSLTTRAGSVVKCSMRGIAMNRSGFGMLLCGKQLSVSKDEILLRLRPCMGRVKLLRLNGGDKL